MVALKTLISIKMTVCVSRMVARVAQNNGDSVASGLADAYSRSPDQTSQAIAIGLARAQSLGAASAATQVRTQGRSNHIIPSCRMS